MSYCRNNGKDSEVYVIGTQNALECCGCRLYKYSFSTQKYSRMIKHLEEHREREDKVPARAFIRLRQEQTEGGDIYAVSVDISGTKSKKLINLPKNVRKTKNELLEQELYKEMQYHRELMVETALEVFQYIYGRQPNRLELSGLADAANIKTELQIKNLLGA